MIKKTGHFQSSEKCILMEGTGKLLKSYSEKEIEKHINSKHGPHF